MSKTGKNLKINTRDGTNYLSNRAIRKLALAGGAVKTSSKIYGQIQELLDQYMKLILNEANTLSISDRCLTIRVRDIEGSLEINKRNN